MRLLVGLAFTLSLAYAQVSSYEEGLVRVEVLSPNLVRLELRGPKGFEDRETFRVLERNWPGAPLRNIERGKEVARLETANWSVSIPIGAKELKGVRLLDKSGRALYEVKGSENADVWLPAPASVPKTWAFADRPRIVPPKWGATPAPTDDPTSGWDVANDAPDLYVFLPNGSYDRLRQDFLRLTGQTEMPPLFMLGLIDSKYYAYSGKEALDRIDQYRKRQIPLDVLTIDTDWRISGSAGYTPDPQYFPDMPGFIRRAHEKDVRLMFNDHPEPQTESGLDPKEIAYRWAGLGGLLGMGLDVWWYDRNWSVGLKEPVPGLRGHVWGMRLYHDMTAKARPNQRPVIMANTDGIDNGFRNGAPDAVTHRYPVQWTGDTRSEWSFLRRAVENAVYSGVQALNPWVNDDLGGHAGQPSPDLYIRYMQYGALCPVMRPHCTKGYDRAPWTFGKDAERIVSDYVRLRYRLLPLFYAAARDAYDRGEPVVRRLDLDYPQYKEAARDDQYLLGKGLLVAPIVGGSTQALPAAWMKTPWKAEYWANDQLTGQPVLTREEPVPGFDLTRDRIAPEVPEDHFSARWTGTLSVPGPMRIAATSDDGIRVWVDDKLVVDKWEPLNSVTNEIPVVFQPGKEYKLRIEYQEVDGGAMMRLSAYPPNQPTERDLWVPPGGWTNLWTGERLTGPVTVKVTSPIDQIPLFAKDGAVVANLPQMQRTEESPWSSVTLDVWPGEGSATLYEDDGVTNAYKAGACRTTALTVKQDERRVTVKIDPAKGTYPGAVANRAWTVRLHTNLSVRRVRVKGASAGEWRAVAHDGKATVPFLGAGKPATDADVVEVPIRPVAVGNAVEVRFDLR